MLDLMHLWYYQPCAQQVFIECLNSLSPEERKIIFRMHKLLYIYKEISVNILHNLISKDFSKSLSFYLQKHKEYLAVLTNIQRNLLPEASGSGKASC